MIQAGEAPYRVGAVANFMLDTARKERVRVTHLKLQKLVYMAYGMSTLVLDKRLFREDIEAWRYGPVVPDLWHEFKAYRSRPIKGRSLEYDPERDKITQPIIDLKDSTTYSILDLTWVKYGYAEAGKLVSLTHAEGTPWDRTVKRHNGEYGHRIPRDLIVSHFDQKFGDLRDEHKELVAEYDAFLAEYGGLE